MYDVKPAGEGEAGGSDDDEPKDIEASIQKEMAQLKSARSDAKAAGRLFCPVRFDLECVLFTKTLPPVEPVEFVHRICRDAKSDPRARKSRYLNRLTPITLSGKANEKAVEDTARKVLAPWFDLKGGSESQQGGTEGTGSDGSQTRPAYSVSRGESRA